MDTVPHYNAAFAAPTQMQHDTTARIGHDASRWLASVPSITKFDRSIVNHFMTTFMKEVPHTLTSFANFSVQGSTTAAEVLAIAAVGGLYCTTSGSHIVAKAMCSDARRILLTRVSPSRC